MSSDFYENVPEVVKVKIDKFKELTAQGKYPYKECRFEYNAFCKDINEKFEEYDGKEVKIAGRLMSKRGQGKVGFYDLMDSTDKIQLFIKKDVVGEEEYALIKSYDIGDILGIDGEVFKTQRGQISVRVKKVTMLSKSIQVLPEKFHGLKDPELRYRQRYVDLIMNPEVKDVFLMRSKIVKCMRDFMDGEGFVEVETPVLGTLAGGANARPFITRHNALDIPMYMRIATELPLKRLIVGGFNRVYEIGRIFRNEGMDATHNPEFTSMESYQSYADFNDVMEMIEKMFDYIATNTVGSDTITYGEHEISLKAPFRKAKMVDLVTEATGVDFDKITDLEVAREEAKKLNVEPEPDWGIGKIIEELFEEHCEANLIQPTFVTHHPVEISPLAKKCLDDERYTQRFELFVAGHEYANGFSELNDPFDQRERFAAQMEKKATGDEEAHPYDTDFINALEVGLPPTGGVGVGVDRLVMLLTNQSSIRDVILFPTMKPLDSVNTKVSESNVEVKEEDKKIDFSNVKIEPLFEEMVDFETFSKSDFRAVKIENCEEVPKSKKLLKFTLNDGTDRKRTILSGIRDYYNPEELIGKTAIAIVNLPPRKMMGIDSEGMLISAVHEEDGKEGLNLLMVDDRIPAGAKLY